MCRVFMNLIQSRAHGAEIPNAFVIIIALNNVYIHKHITVYIECAKQCYFRYDTQGKSGTYWSLSPRTPIPRSIQTNRCFQVSLYAICHPHRRVVPLTNNFPKAFSLINVVSIKNTKIRDNGAAAVRLHCQTENYY